MYWQKRFDREDPNKKIEEKILEIRETHKDYGYRRVLGELRNQGCCVNKKKGQRIMQKLGLQVHHSLARAVNTAHTREKSERLLLIV